MLEELKKSLDKGIDYAFATKEKITRAAQELARENKLTGEEAKKLMDHLLKKSEETRKSVEADLQEFVQKTLKKMNVPSSDEIKKLEERIKKLESAAKAPPKSRPAKKTSPAAKKAVS